MQTEPTIGALPAATNRSSRGRRISEGVVQICALLGGTPALLAAIAWPFDRWSFTTLGSAYVPMAPATAWSMVLLSAALFLHSRRPGWRAGRIASAVAIGLVGVTGLLVLTRAGIPFAFEFEAWLVPAGKTVGDIPVGRMSPYTAAMFLILAAALGCLLGPGRKPGLRRGLALALSTAVVAGCAHTALSYAVGVPLLYGSGLIPMALLTAITFTFLGLGVAVASRPEQLLLGGLAGVAPAGRGARSKSFIGAMAAVVAVLITGITTVGYLYLKRELADARRAVEHQLRTVADLKARRIEEWRADQLGDASWILHDSALGTDAQLFLAGPAVPEVEARLLDWLAAWQRIQGCAQVLLLDTSGRSRLAVPAGRGDLEPDLRHQLERTVQERTVVTADLHRSTADPTRVWMDLFVPLIAPPGPGPERPVVGVLVLRTDPQAFLFPMIEEWPTPSPSAETLLVRREGNEVVYLNELRHRKSTALNLRIRLIERSLPAVRAVLGEKGVVEGVDYRGVPVLAALRPIADSPWFIVAKQDQAEVFAPLRRLAWSTGGVVATLILAVLLALALLWRRREQLFAERELLERRQAEQVREALLGDIERANAELERLVYVASHDLRSPLVNLQGFGQRLEKSCAELAALLAQPEVPATLREPVARIVGERIPGALNYIRSSTARMDALVSGLLKMSRLGHVAMTIEPIDADRIVQEAIAAQTFQIQAAGADVQAEPLPRCLGDRNLLGQVFANLLDNALKYRDPARPLQVHISGRSSDGRATYCVADNGQGIAPEHQDRIWEMFHRLNPEGPIGGEGLGLNLVRRIVDRHRGRVWVESVPGQGSRFFLSLPTS